MPTVEPIQWAHEAKASLFGCNLIKVDYLKIQISLEFSKLFNLTFWNVKRSTLLVKDKSTYAIGAHDKEVDKQYWALKVEESFSNLQVVSVYVSSNDNIILSFGNPLDKSKMFENQLIFNAPDGVRLKI